jgi:hypothetical protein
LGRGPEIASVSPFEIICGYNSVPIPFALLFILVAMRFALVEGKAAIAHLILNFKLSPSNQTQIPMKFSTKGLMKPENGMWLNLEARI